MREQLALKKARRALQQDDPAAAVAEEILSAARAKAAELVVEALSAVLVLAALAFTVGVFLEELERNRLRRQQRHQQQVEAVYRACTPHGFHSTQKTPRCGPR